MQKQTISVIGLGKLGSPMAAVYAHKGYNVIGLDLNADYVRLINQAKPPVEETNLAKYITENKERISATQDYKEAILNSDITFIIVPTPSMEDGNFSTKYAVEAAKEIAKVLKEKNSFHVVDLVSTVTPGSTEKDIKPVLEEYSGKKCGVDFGLCYNPEFIALGSVIKDLLNPYFILIGESDSRSGDILENFYKNICENNPQIKRMNFANAELTKIASNTFVTTKISYGNMLAELCEKLPGGNVDVVTDALGNDTRIGHRFLKGALGYGGPCLPRDNRAIVYTAKQFGLNLDLPQITDKINKHQISRVVDKIISVLPANGRVGFLGLSYKANTGVVEESQPLEIAKALSEKGVLMAVYDPAAFENAKKILGNNVVFASSLRECAQSSDVVVIATDWPEFKNIQPDFFANKKAIIIDCWRILKDENYKDAAEYIPLGVNRKIA